MADKPVLEPTTQAFLDALAAQGGKRTMSFPTPTPAPCSKTRKPASP
jgi:hypothetical protein